MTEILENLAAAIGARIGIPDGDGHFIVITGQTDGNGKKLSTPLKNNSELSFELISVGRFQNALLEAHTEAGAVIIASGTDSKPVTLPRIEDTATGFICRSDWRILWRNSL
jgi:hypothetical protein